MDFFHFLCKNRPKWRHNDVIVIGYFFAFFDGFYYLCQNFSPFKAFLRKLIFDVKWRHFDGFFLEKRPHNDVTPKKIDFWPSIFFYSFLENFSPIGAFFQKLEGGAKIGPPPTRMGGTHIPTWIGLKIPKVITLFLANHFFC